MDSAGCPCLASHCKSLCGIYNLSQYWGLWYNNSLILSFLQPTAPMCHYFRHQQEPESDFSPKGLYQNDSPCNRHEPTAQADSWWAAGLAERKSGENLQAPRGSEKMLGCVAATGQEQSWSRAGFSDVLGPCSGSDYFYLGASWLWCPPAHEQKVHSSMCSIGVLLLTKANQAADWKSRADTCDECTVGHRVIGCNEICPLKS